MARQTKPSIYIVAETYTNFESVGQMLEAIGMEHEKAWEWADQHLPDETAAADALVEIAGRLCYKSFEVGLNKNVTKIREDTHEYIGNILKSGHGAVLEHASVSVAFINVSRVFTHEIVRHRAGMAFSQESLRYVRLDDLGYRVPSVFSDKEFLRKLYDSYPTDHHYREKLTFEAFAEQAEGLAEQVLQQAFEGAEKAVNALGDAFKIDDIQSFELKKALTSAFRRVAPLGLTTNILVTANHRAWRHIIELRTSKHAEEEARKIVSLVAEDFKKRFPHLYQDMTRSDDGSYVFTNSKV